MHNTFILSYIPKDSFIDRLTGSTKLIFLLMWLTTAMVTYDTRILVLLSIGSLVLFKLSKIKFSEIKYVAYLIIAFLVLNLLTIYLFSPEEGVKIYGTRHEIAHIVGWYTITWEQIFYEFNIFVKYLAVIPISILFVSTTYPSEFAASLSSIGVSYKVSYAVSIALRYIPNIQDKFFSIRQAQQARGIDSSSKQKLSVRMKNISLTLFPLIFSSMEMIDVISNAMLLRGFGKHSKRTWYTARKMQRNDYLALALGVIIMGTAVALLFVNGGRFYSPFQ